MADRKLWQGWQMAELGGKPKIFFLGADTMVDWYA